MKVHEIMTGHARSVTADTTLVEAAGLMRELDVGALPVCEGDTVAGIVTDRDIVVRGVADAVDATSSCVSDVMSGGVVGVSADDDVELAARIMEQHQIRRLPVLDRARRLVGMVSLGDIATSSNPAFSGIALRDVSEPNEPSARRRHLEQESASARMPTVSGARRGPASAGRSGRGRAGSRQRSGRSETRSPRASQSGKPGASHAHGRKKSSKRR